MVIASSFFYRCRIRFICSCGTFISVFCPLLAFLRGYLNRPKIVWLTTECMKNRFSFEEQVLNITVRIAEHDGQLYCS